MISLKFRSFLQRTQTGSVLGRGVAALRTAALVMRARRRAKAARVPSVVRLEPTRNAWDLFAQPVRRVCVVKGDHVGDLVVALPAVARLREHFAEARFTLVCSPLTAALARGLGLFDEVVEAGFSTTRGIVTHTSVAEVSAVLAGMGAFDLAIDLKVEFEPRYARDHLDARVKACYSNGGAISGAPGSLVLPAVTHTTSLHNRELLMQLADAVIGRFESAAAAGRAATAIGRVAPRPIATGNGEIAVNLGAGYDIRCWSPAHYARLFDLLAGHHHGPIVLYGTAADRAAADLIAAQCRLAQPRILVGQLSLLESIQAAAAATLFIGHDTGTTHAAAASGVPVVCIFSGVTLNARWQPEGARVLVIRNPVACAPCGLRERRTCPNGLACLDGIPAETVAAACLELLGGGAAA